MTIKSKIRNIINKNSLTRRWSVNFCARFSMRIYSFQNYLSIEDLRHKIRAALWKRMLALLDKLDLEKIVISKGEATFFYRDGCAFNIITTKTSISKTLFSHGGYEENETNLLSKLVKPGWTVIDVGANFGWHSIHLSRFVGPQGKVLSFEPVPDAYRELTANLTLNSCQNLETYNIALGNKEDTVTMYVPAIDYGLAAASQFLDIGKKIRVPMIRLDDFIKQKNIPRVDFIKADIEGGELNLLRGAESILERFRPGILIEMVDIHCQRFGYTPQDVLQFLQSKGYFGLYINEVGELVELDATNLFNGNYFFTANKDGINKKSL